MKASPGLIWSLREAVELIRNAKEKTSVRQGIAQKSKVK